MPKTLTLILGGARSGKSTYAQKLAQARGGDDVLFVATAQALDDEMQSRIEAHRRDRPAAWRTLEAPHDAGKLIQQAEPSAIVLVDCLTLLVSNAVLTLPESASAMEAEAAALAELDDLIVSYRLAAPSGIGRAPIASAPG